MPSTWWWTKSRSLRRKSTGMAGTWWWETLEIRRTKRRRSTVRLIVISWRTSRKVWRNRRRMMRRISWLDEWMNGEMGKYQMKSFLNWESSQWKIILNGTWVVVPSVSWSRRTEREKINDCFIFSLVSFHCICSTPSCLKLTQLSFKDLIWSNKNSVFSFILQKSIHFQKLYDQINL